MECADIAPMTHWGTKVLLPLPLNDHFSCYCILGGREGSPALPLPTATINRECKMFALTVYIGALFVFPLLLATRGENRPTWSLRYHRNLTNENFPRCNEGAD